METQLIDIEASRCLDIFDREYREILQYVCHALLLPDAARESAREIVVTVPAPTLRVMRAVYFEAVHAIVMALPVSTSQSPRHS